MLLNQRQIEIILELYEHTGAYFTAASLAKPRNISLRTVQGDLHQIRDELLRNDYAVIESQKGKGSFLRIKDQDAFSDWVNALYVQYSCDDLDYPTNRVSRIIFLLLGTIRSVLMYDLEDELHISHSTLVGDLKKVQEQLHEFGLRLIRDNNRLKIAGYEVNKRRCLAKNTMYLAHVQGNKNRDCCIDMQRVAFIKDVLLNVFTSNQYYISDIDFNNAVLTVNIMFHRILRQFFIKENELEITDELDKEMTIAQKVFYKVQQRFLCNIPREEIEFFALYLKGQEICKDKEIISKDVDEFINEAFVGIRQNYGVDFTNNIGLKLAMGLHCIPMIIRLKYEMQIQSEGLDTVKANFPLGYDIATYFTYLLQERFGGKANECEIALVAAHFFGSMLELKQKQQNIRILVISAMKQSMTVLLRSMLRKWFAAEIAQLDFLQASDVTDEILDEYDVFLTTEKNEMYEKGLAMLINSFVTEKDRRNIKLLMDGFKNVDDVVEIFQRDLFFCVDGMDKQSILELLSDRSEAKYDLHDLHKAVMEREGIGSTFFSQAVALPHPIKPVSSDTFISVGIAKEPVVWDEEGHRVNIVMLLHIGKNNIGSFQLWDLMSYMLLEKEWVRKVVERRDFDGFIACIADVLKKRF